MPPTVQGFRTAMPLSRPLVCVFLFVGIAGAVLAQFPATRVAATSLRMPSEGTTSAYKAETAFGGWKQSGLGRELGSRGVEEFLRWKRVAVDRREPLHLSEAFG